jgi:Ser/Thr protein kinase RdoA (MazF antagonist)
MSRFGPRPFERLSPDTVLDALESCGLPSDARLFALNSYENRVYQAGTEAGWRVLKFYRPERWSDAQILEEHAFAAELSAAELPVVAPVSFGGRTLLRHAGFRYAVYPWCAGRPFDLDDPTVLTRLGRLLAHVHMLGEQRSFGARLRLSVRTLGQEPVRQVLDSGLLPQDLESAYRQLTEQLLQRLDGEFAELEDLRWIRIHGDCHQGNLLLQDDVPTFVDFDDCLQGPAVQDLWMLLGGDADEQRGNLEQVLAGYEEFRGFDYRELRLIEPLRALRILRHAGWIAQRWEDPAFPRAFPGFAEHRFWEGHLQELREQLGLLDDPPLFRMG